MARSPFGPSVPRMLKLMTTHDTTPAPRLDAIERVHGARAVLSDLDGCLAAGNIALPGAVDLAEQLGERLFIVSNNSTHDPLGLSNELAQHGLKVPVHRIVLAGTLAIDTIAREQAGARVMILGGATLRSRARNLGLIVADRDVDTVLVARDLAFSYARLEAAVQAIAHGARLYAANPDDTHPGHGGRLVPETGALLAAIRACVPAVPCTVIGKPEPAIYREALRLAGCEAHEAVMLGDNPATDIAGARAMGIDGVLVGPNPEAEVPAIGRLVR